MTASAWPRRVLRRRSLDTALDWLRFRLDTFPRRGPLRGMNLANYQPLPWVGLSEGDRTEGTLSRWREIESVLAELPDLSTALDIGANQGFFAINLAKRGVTTVALEVNPVAYRTALYASRKAGV